MHTTADTTEAELRLAYDRSTFSRSMTFYEACTAPWSRAALELGARLLRNTPRIPRDFTEPRPSRYQQKDLINEHHSDHR